MQKNEIVSDTMDSKMSVKFTIKDFFWYRRDPPKIKYSGELSIWKTRILNFPPERLLRHLWTNP
jgi:hypothetical protein